jgi:hypothetical protein
MATNEAALEHLRELRDSVNDAINTVGTWQSYGSKFTSGNQTAELAKVTTVPTARQHASDCAICTAWDGSVRA